MGCEVWLEAHHVFSNFCAHDKLSVLQPQLERAIFARPGAVVDVSPALVPLVGPAGESFRRLKVAYHGGAFSMQLVGEGLLHPGLVER